MPSEPRSAAIYKSSGNAERGTAPTTRKYKTDLQPSNGQRGYLY